MLKKKYRLQVQNFLKQKGRTARSNYFSIKSFKAKNSYSRFGVIISKKVFKKAVERNKLKRIIFGFLKENYNKFKSMDFLIIVHPKTAGKGKKELIEELNRLLLHF